VKNSLRKLTQGKTVFFKYWGKLQFFGFISEKSPSYSLYIAQINGFWGGRCQFREWIGKIHHLVKIIVAQKVCKNARKFAEIGQKFTKMRVF